MREKWQITIKSFRSTTLPGPERTMTTVTMKGTTNHTDSEMIYTNFTSDNVFVLVDDPTALARSDFLQLAPHEAPQFDPTHYRQTYVTANPPGALEQLLDQLRAPWVSGRNHPQNQGGSQRFQDSGVQLSVTGQVYTVGTDWIVRAGNVAISGGTMKGLLLEESQPSLFAFHCLTQLK